MKKFLFFLLILSSCDSAKSDSQILSDMKPPVVLIGIRKETIPSITVKDSLGKVHYIYGGMAYDFLKYELKDTIK